jgi:hypothetical protein
MAVTKIIELVGRYNGPGLPKGTGVPGLGTRAATPPR